MGVTTGASLGARTDLLPLIASLDKKVDRWRVLSAAAAAERAEEGAGSGDGGKEKEWLLHAALVPLLNEGNIREDRPVADRPPLEVRNRRE